MTEQHTNGALGCAFALFLLLLIAGLASAGEIGRGMVRGGQLLQGVAAPAPVPAESAPAINIPADAWQVTEITAVPGTPAPVPDVIGPWVTADGLQTCIWHRTAGTVAGQVTGQTTCEAR